MGFFLSRCRKIVWYFQNVILIPVSTNDFQNRAIQIFKCAFKMTTLFERKMESIEAYFIITFTYPSLYSSGLNFKLKCHTYIGGGSGGHLTPRFYWCNWPLTKPRNSNFFVWTLSYCTIKTGMFIRCFQY